MAYTLFAMDEFKVNDERKSRQRGENWTQEEKELFFKIMQQSASIIENKKIDTYTNRRKQLEWMKVQNRLKELMGKPREIGQLKGFWRRAKHTAKRNMCRIEKLRAGGGQPPTPSQEDQMIINMCPTDFVDETNDCDSDGSLENMDTIKQEENDAHNCTKYDIDVKIENVHNEGGPTAVEEVVTVPDIHIDEVLVTQQHTQEDIEINTSNHKNNCNPGLKEAQKERLLSYVKNHRTETNQKVMAPNMELRNVKKEIMVEEHAIMMEIHKQNLSHQALRNKLEIDILLLDKEKKELEIKILRKSLE